MSPLEVFAIRLKWNQVINVLQTQKNQRISDMWLQFDLRTAMIKNSRRHNLHFHQSKTLIPVANADYPLLQHMLRGKSRKFYCFGFLCQVNLLEDALSGISKPAIKCTILLDHLRGSRGKPNSRSMLQKLVQRYGEDFRLHLYHTPNLRGLLRRIGPERFNEVMGLQHMKIYLFDDDVVLSG